MKHLILGSAGQIGYHLVEYLEEQGEEVIEYDIINYWDEDLRQDDNPKLEYLIQKCNFVHFLAFDVGGAKYLEKYQDTYEFIDNNLKIMNNTFRLLKQYNKPFIFASSQMSDMSYSTYGVLKLIGEKITKSLNGLTVRFWNVYGYEKDLEKFHVITDFIKMAKEDNIVKCRTNGDESRQFLYGEDAAECLYTLSKKYSSINKSDPLHISSFRWTSIKEVGELITKIYNCPLKFSNKEDLTQKNMKNEPNKYILNFWEPKYSLEEGIKKIIELCKE